MWIRGPLTCAVPLIQVSLIVIYAVHNVMHSLICYICRVVCDFKKCLYNSVLSCLIKINNGFTKVTGICSKPE